MIKLCKAEDVLSSQFGLHGTFPVLRDLRPNPDWAKLPLFDRKDWIRVQFGDVVQNVNETERSPVEAGIERFIGLEHLEPGSLHVRAWGDVANGTTFTRRCRPGQVLFGKRRAYQRKVAVAEFDAVVSGDIYVFSPKDERLLPELLPFLCMSERFFLHAVGTSAGSLSPRTNWGSLAGFDFDLPPLDRQKRIAEMLWAVDETIEAARTNLNILSSIKQAAMEELTVFRNSVRSNEPKPPKYPMRLLGDMVTTCQYGLSCPLSDSGRYSIIRMMNYDEELIAPTPTELKYADLSEHIAKNFEVKKGDILFNRTNSSDLVGKVGIFNLDGCFLFASYLVRIQTDQSRLLPEFLNYYLNSRPGQTSVRAFATPGVSQSNINVENLKKVQVPVPQVSEQKKIIRKLDEISSVYRASRMHIITQYALLHTLVNLIIRGTS